MSIDDDSYKVLHCIGWICVAAFAVSTIIELLVTSGAYWKGEMESNSVLHIIMVILYIAAHVIVFIPGVISLIDPYGTDDELGAAYLTFLSICSSAWLCLIALAAALFCHVGFGQAFSTLGRELLIVLFVNIGAWVITGIWHAIKESIYGSGSLSDLFLFAWIFFAIAFAVCSIVELPVTSGAFWKGEGISVFHIVVLVLYLAAHILAFLSGAVDSYMEAGASMLTLFSIISTVWLCLIALAAALSCHTGFGQSFSMLGSWLLITLFVNIGVWVITGIRYAINEAVDGENLFGIVGIICAILFAISTIVELIVTSGAFWKGEGNSIIHNVVIVFYTAAHVFVCISGVSVQNNYDEYSKYEIKKTDVSICHILFSFLSICSSVWLCIIAMAAAVFCHAGFGQAFSTLGKGLLIMLFVNFAVWIIVGICGVLAEKIYKRAVENAIRKEKLAHKFWDSKIADVVDDKGRLDKEMIIKLCCEKSGNFRDFLNKEFFWEDALKSLVDSNRISKKEVRNVNKKDSTSSLNSTTILYETKNAAKKQEVTDVIYLDDD